MFDHISKDLEVCQKYSAARRIFNSLLGVLYITFIFAADIAVLDLYFRYRYFKRFYLFWWTGQQDSDDDMDEVSHSVIIDSN